MHITEKIIREIMDAFGEEKRIFQSEAQFQFALAWELQKHIQDDRQVLLEMVSCTRKPNGNQKAKRLYSDIVLKNNTDNSYIVLELKYKTKQDNTYGVYLTNQGATDEGRYDYLWDIRRIELLKKPDNDHYEYNPVLGKFMGGFAIMLTNENNYWQGNQNKRKDALDSQFAIDEGKTISEEVDWNTTEKKDWMRSRPQIKFDGEYTFHWNSYYDTGNTTKTGLKKEFRYLITRIDANQ